MQAGRGIENQVTGGQLYGVRAVGILHDQFATIVFVGLGEKQRGGKIGANAVWRPADLANGVIDMGAECLAALVTIEQRRKYLRAVRRK